MNKLISLCAALVACSFAACESRPAPTPGEIVVPRGVVDRINALVAAPQTVTFTRINTSLTSLELSTVIKTADGWRIKVALVPELRTPAAQELMKGWQGDKPVAIEWEGTFEHLTPEGDAVAIAPAAVGDTTIDPYVRTLCGDTQRVRGQAWITVDGLRLKAYVTFGVVGLLDIKGTDEVANATGPIAGPGNCQIQASIWSLWTYSWCTNTTGVENGSCAFVQQVDTTTQQVCLSGTVGGGVGSGSGITIGGGGGTGTATGTWGTQTSLVWATFAGNCVHVDGWTGDTCECRATGGPTFTTMPMGCSSGGGGTCSTPAACPAP